MPTILLITVLIAGIVVLTPTADRLRIPLPVLLTIFGLVVPLIPGTPGLTLNPDLILPVVLPPLLFAATTRSTVHEFRASARPILVLAVGLTVASAAAVAVLAHAVGFDWVSAFVLGAVVAPPDPVAATAVARRLKLPQNLVTVLEGEGMFNDATALVLYGVAVSAAVTGELHAGFVVEELLLAVVGGVVIGFAVGWVTNAALARLHDAAAETTVTVAVPFLTFLGAEHVHASGVLAVLTMGLYLRDHGHPSLTAGGWLLGRSVWRYADYLITNAVFVLIGFELTEVLGGSHVDETVVLLAGLTVVVLVVLRFAWLFPASIMARGSDHDPRTPIGPRETTVAAWAGMRGVVTIATALALPLTAEGGEAFPDRGAIVFCGLICVLVTLVVQGLTLTPLVKALGVGTEEDPVREAAVLRRRAAAAGLDAVRGPDDDATPDHVRRAVVLQYEGYIAAQDALGLARRGAPPESSGRDRLDGEAADPDPEALERLLRRAIETERDVVLRARTHGEVSSEAADEVLEDIEARAVRSLS